LQSADQWGGGVPPGLTGTARDPAASPAAPALSAVAMMELAGLAGFRRATL